MRALTVDVGMGVEPMARGGADGRSAQAHEHQRDERLEDMGDRGRDGELECQYRASERRQGHGVADAPERADQRGAPETGFLAHDRRDRHQMVGIEGMPEPENEPDRGYGEGRRLQLRSPIRFLGTARWPSDRWL